MNVIENTRILIPMDGSPLGESVLLALNPLIRSQRIESTLFHVAESKEGGQKAEVQLEMLRKALETQGIAARVRMVPGRPAEEILRQAKTGDFDLVAMATHGRTGLDRVLLGSVAEEVVRSSPVPMLLCKKGAIMGDWERIVVALDGSPGSEEILSDVVRLGKSLRATLYLTRVGLSLLRSDAYRGVHFDHQVDDSHSYLESIAVRLISQGVQAQAEAREGMAAVEIAHLAQELEAGLICMTTEGRPELHPGLDRSVTADVIRSAPCPVFVRHMSGTRGTQMTAKKSGEDR